MTGMLASVNSLAEAKLVLAENVDIIDLKEPAQGALGGLDIGLVKEIVSMVNGKRPVSATIGDLPMQPELIFNAAKNMAETGVDYVKIGIFPSENQNAVIETLAQLCPRFNLIGVLFADTQFDIALVDSLITAGFHGIMLDTMDKAKGSLTRIMDDKRINQFVCHVTSYGRICGLAGSLKLEDISTLLHFTPDYLGFRGALCEQHNRTGQLSTHAIQRIKQAIINFPN